jgi:hypothetical protein
MTCRQEILDAIRRLERRHARNTFDLYEIVHEVLAKTDRYKESSIRTHIVSSMCSNAPVNHATTYSDLVRVDRGRYRLA